MIRSIEDRSGGGSSCAIPCQIVGTAPANVTRSSATICASAAGSIRGPGSTSLLPASAAAYGRPQAFAWNIGTIGSTVSRSRRPSESAWLASSEWSTVERCEYTTPFGKPVVPLV